MIPTKFHEITNIYPTQSVVMGGHTKGEKIPRWINPINFVSKIGVLGIGPIRQDECEAFWGSFEG